MYMNSGSHTYATPGTYTVSLTGTMLGYLDTCMETKTMVITVLGPAPGFTVDQSQEPTVSFTNTSTGNGTLSHAWDFGDGNTSTAQDPSHTYTAVGTYTVTLTTTDSCGSVTTTQTVTITTVGVNEVVSHDVKAFYNATEQTLNVTMPGSANAAVEVYNAVGAKIYAETGVNIATKVISLNSLAEGTYMVRVITAKGIGATKFVVIK
jgi:PKD repeat protein